MLMTTPAFEDAGRVRDLLTDDHRTVSRYHDTVEIPQLILDAAGIDTLIDVLTGAKQSILRFGQEAESIRQASPGAADRAGEEAGPE